MTKLPDNVNVKELQYRYMRRIKEQIHWMILMEDANFLNLLRKNYPEMWSLFSTDVYPVRQSLCVFMYILIL